MFTIISRLLCAGYCVALTVLLVVPNPLRLLGIQRLPGPPGGRGVHFVLLSALTLLALASRWAIRRGTLLGLLIAYGILTETLQWFAPPRTVELLDYAENLAGVLTGAAIWWAFESRAAAAKVRQAILTTNNQSE